MLVLHEIKWTTTYGCFSGTNFRSSRAVDVVWIAGRRKNSWISSVNVQGSCLSVLLQLSSSSISRTPIREYNLLQSPENSAREGKIKFKTNTTLDSFYTSILQEVFGDVDDRDNDPRVRSVLGAMILAVNPLSPSAIAKLLDLGAEEVSLLSSSTHSLLILQEDVDCPIRPFRKSSPDFITDTNKRTNPRSHVSPDHHSQILTACPILMDRTPEGNTCKLPDGVANSDVSNLKERSERYIEPALRYACGSWYKHLVGGHTTSVNTLEITSVLSSDGCCFACTTVESEVHL